MFYKNLCRIKSSGNKRTPGLDFSFFLSSAFVYYLTNFDKISINADIEKMQTFPKLMYFCQNYVGISPVSRRPCRR